MSALPEAPPAPAPSLAPAQKAAIVLSALPEEEAASLLQQLGEGQIRRYVRAAAELRMVPAPVLEAVVLEFLETLGSGDLRLDADHVERVLARIMAPDAVADTVIAATGSERSLWDDLRRLDPERLAGWIEAEHPRVGAIVLRRFDSERAAEILEACEEDAADRIVACLDATVEVAPDLLAMIEAALRDALLGAEAASPERAVGAIFDGLSNDRRDGLLRSLGEARPAFASGVRDAMFLFDDIPARIATTDVPLVARAVDPAVLRTALASATARGSEAAEHVLSNMSPRLAEQLREEIAEGTAPAGREGDKAEGEVVAAIKRLADAGEITLEARADD